MNATVEMQEVIAQIKQYVENDNMSFAETGRLLGENRHTIKNIYRKYIKPYNEGERTPQQQLPKPVVVESIPTGNHIIPNYNDQFEQPSFPTVSKIRENMSMRQEVLELKTLATQRAKIEELKDSIRSLDIPSIKAPTMLHTNTKNDSVGILLISDIHLGQLTEGRLTGGYEYSPEITKQQFASLFDQVSQQAVDQAWTKLIILDLGDDVDGDDMRPSQHRHVGPLVVQQCAMYGRWFAQFVANMLEYVPSIHVERVPGNHARTSQRPGLAGLAEIDPMDSYDWIAGEFAREILRDQIEQGLVEIINHETFYSALDVFGYKVLFEHGSSLKGSGGPFGAPMAGIQRALLGYRELEGEIDLYVLGHFHRPYLLNAFFNTTIVGNGSFPPTSPFVMAMSKSANRPSQSLITIEKGKGVTNTKTLWLDTKRVARKVC